MMNNWRQGLANSLQKHHNKITYTPDIGHQTPQTTIVVQHLLSYHSDESESADMLRFILVKIFFSWSLTIFAWLFNEFQGK